MLSLGTSIARAAVVVLGDIATHRRYDLLHRNGVPSALQQHIDHKAWCARITLRDRLKYDDLTERGLIEAARFADIAIDAFTQLPTPHRRAA